MTTVPSKSVISPVKILKVVVFPAPFTPSSPKHSPRAISILILLTAIFDCLINRHDALIVEFTYLY